LEGLNAFAFGAWLATRITGCVPLLESPDMIAVLDRVAVHELWMRPHPLQPVPPFGNNTGEPCPPS
jgi:hypothetical protein